MQAVLAANLTGPVGRNVAWVIGALCVIHLQMTSIATAAGVMKVDGRRQRSERTRLTIIQAYLELLRRHGVMPTAAHIADEAGCSTRSIFERFSDLDALSLATADYAIVQGQAEAVARHVDGDRPTRIRSHVATRAFACEKWLPLWRIITRQDQIADLKMRVVLVRLANIERMKLMYAPELATPARGATGPAAHCVGSVDQLRKLGPDAQLPQLVARSHASSVAGRDRPDAAVMSTFRHPDRSRA